MFLNHHEKMATHYFQKEAKKLSLWTHFSFCLYTWKHISKKKINEVL